jgi:hypothetical protein
MIRQLFLGSSVLVGFVSLLYIKIDSLFDWAPPVVKNNSLFNVILESFFPNDAAPIFSLRGEFGLKLTRPVAANHSILTLSLDTNPFVIDGTRNVPSQLTSIGGFGDLSHEAKVMLSIALYKVSSDEFSNPFSLLWKGVGVRPIPDVKWVRYRGLFALGVKKTGVREIDAYITRAYEVVGECMSFVRQQHSLDKHLFQISEDELRWTWVFLNAFGVSVSGGGKILEPHLLFARRTLHAASAVSWTQEETGKLKIFSAKPLDRGEEILLDASGEMSDGFALLFHGSWVADASIHRGKFSLPFLGSAECDNDGDNRISFWLSNDVEDLEKSRKKMTRCMQLTSEAAIEKFCQLITEELVYMQKDPVGESWVEAVRFHYFNLLYSELLYWEGMKG